MAPSTADIARRYIEHHGWTPIPVKHHAKTPIDANWPQLIIKPEDVERRFPDDVNIGVLLGRPSGGLIDVDLDCIEAIEIAPSVLPATSTFGRASRPRSHWLYRCAGMSTRKLCDENQKMILEIRSTGTQTVFPPSVHPSGELIAWDRKGPSSPIAVEADALIKACARLAALSLMRRAELCKQELEMIDRVHKCFGPGVVVRKAID